MGSQTWAWSVALAVVVEGRSHHVKPSQIMGNSCYSVISNICLFTTSWKLNLIKSLMFDWEQVKPMSLNWSWWYYLALIHLTLHFNFSETHTRDTLSNYLWSIRSELRPIKWFYECLNLWQVAKFIYLVFTWKISEALTIAQMMMKLIYRQIYWFVASITHTIQQL